ncbi:hypothetical protein ACFL2X_06755 [Candidatus Latescibacterota bacterium]
MWERINKYVYFFSVLVSEAWLSYEIFAYNTGDLGIFEAISAFIASLGFLIYEEIKDLRKSEESDITLFKEFIEALPYEGSITFIDCTDMSCIHFDPEKHNDLRNFFYHWDDASHEFVDIKIEKKRKVLWELIQEYIMELGTNTVPTDDGLQTVPPEWKTEQPERFQEVVDNFHDLAGQIVLAHQELIRYAKKKLRI